MEWRCKMGELGEFVSYSFGYIIDNAFTRTYIHQQLRHQSK